MLTFVSLIRAALQSSVSLLRLLLSIHPPTDHHILYPQIITHKGVSIISPYHMCSRICIMVLFIAGTSLQVFAQCKTFVPAEESNPLLSPLPAGITLSGFDFVDIDGDGDKDCFAIPVGGSPMLFLNTGSAHRPEFALSRLSGFEMTETPIGSPTIQFVDIDGDKDFDCFISDVSYEPRAATGVRFYRNTGSATRPHFTEDAENNPVAFARTSINYMMFMFSDIDKDGDYDFYYTGMYNYTFFAYDQFTYLNSGSKTAPSYTMYSNEHNHDFKNQRIFYDWSKDGLTDYFRIDTYNNSIDYWKNSGNLMMPSFTLDYSNAPVFTHGSPARLVNLNETFSRSIYGRRTYCTLAPVAVIKAGLVLQAEDLSFGLAAEISLPNTIIAGN